MAHNGPNRAYAVTLGPAAVRTIEGLPDLDRRKLASALRTELANGPNTVKEITFDSSVRTDVDPGASPDKVFYTATPLSFAGYTAVHRPMTGEEIERLRLEQGHSMATWGFYVIDILPAESAFSRPRLI